MKDLSLHLMDIVQNSVSAGADSIRVAITADKRRDLLAMRIDDNGKGMAPELLARVTDPFTTSRTTRRVGLGIPLLEASARQAGGGLSIRSEEGMGTSVEAAFTISNIDRPPLGDVADTMVSLIMARPDIRYVLELSGGNSDFRFDIREICERLGDIPVTNYEVLEWMGDYLAEGLKTTFGGVLDEIVG